MNAETGARLDALVAESNRLARAVVAARAAGDELAARRANKHLARICGELVPLLRVWEAERSH